MDGSSIRPDVAPDPLLSAGTPVSVRELAASLIDAGHRRLAVVAAAAAQPDGGAVHVGAINDALSAARLPPGQIIDTGEDLERAFFTVFRGTRYPTGLVCSDAATADAALRSLRGLGFRVPGDMTVVWPAQGLSAAALA